jgi:uroporphyrinogen-III synthase
MREIPLAENRAAFDFLAKLESDSIDVVIFLTGVGTRVLVESLAPRCTAERFAALLAAPGVTVVARGPKPLSVLKQLGRPPDITAPEPNTWRELLAAIDQRQSLRGRRVAVQEYGSSNEDLVRGLTERGAELVLVPVYRWGLPEDLGPLRDGVRQWADGAIDIVVFTSAQQVDHVVRIATELKLLDDMFAKAAQTVVASVGPICSAALHAHGLPVDIEPQHHRMGHLVAELARRGVATLAAKRRG